MKYSEIIKQNKLLENSESKNSYEIAIFSNIMVHQLKDIEEYSLRSSGINANISLGDYDNILQDSLVYQKSNAIVIFWELYNLIDGLQYRIELLTSQEYQDLITKTKAEIKMVFNNLKDIPLVLINKFSTIIFEQNSLKRTRLEELASILNSYIENIQLTNITVIDIDKVIANVSINNSIDLRHYSSSKTLYSIEFYKEYASYIKPIFQAVNGKTKKALIFDCDNTLWKGVLGEDGFDGIKMFNEVQHLAVSLAKQGVIIGLCSKNNPEDVDNVLLKHKEMILKDSDIVIKKVNWTDKATNLTSIAKELNIGLDSFVFVDDSNFEVNLIKEKLPMVEVVQVPPKEHEYSMLLRKVSNLFYNPTQTEEDLKKVAMYKAQVQRVQEEENIGNIEDYLKSLELNIDVYVDDMTYVQRISQMTQKTNQFNLTTKRYTENDIKSFIENSEKMVIAIGVSDKFGDNGIVGLVILDLVNNSAEVDTLLMSCRVLGRNIEYKLMDIIMDNIKAKNATIVHAKYIPTYKNKQVEELFDRYGFELLENSNDLKKYQLNVTDYKYTKTDYIKVTNGN